MKAIEILENHKKFEDRDLGYYDDEYNEAISEIKALIEENRNQSLKIDDLYTKLLSLHSETCETCEYNQSCKILKAYIDVCDWKVDETDFFCSEYVKKDAQ